MAKSLFISFEGIDGCGKSTQIRLLHDYLTGKGLEVLLTREPGGSDISEKIREILLDKKNSDMTDRTEALLYAAARDQLVNTVIIPALQEGKIVLCDRFVDSSEAYQGFGRGLGSDYVRGINSGIMDHLPDITFYFRLSPEEAQRRIARMKRDTDRLEEAGQTFFKRTNDGFNRIAERDAGRIITLNAGDTIENIHKSIVETVERYLEQ
jgi:dTMP kinase